MSELDARLRPVFGAMEDAIKRFEILAGENIYMLTLLLLGSIEDAPADVRELFRNAVVQALLKEYDAGRVLKLLCIDGKL